MKIAFHDDGPLDYTPQTPYERPLGGAESTAAYLSAAMAQRGHEVYLVNRSTFRGLVHGVEVTGFDACRPGFLNTFDIIISLTKPIGTLFRQAGVKTRMVQWQHQASSTQRVKAFTQPAERAAWNHFVFVSEDQRRAFSDRLGIDGIVLRNAAAPGVLSAPVSEDCFLDRGEDPKLIFASAPGHGLELLLTAFAAIREELPGATLQVCSDQGLYQKASADDPYSAVYALARALPGVEFAGSVSQVALGAQFARADILAYPTNFVETCCLVAIEAAASGCTFVGTDLGALRETMCGYGHFMPYEDSRSWVTRGFKTLLVDTVRNARADPKAFKQRRRDQISMFRQTHTWERRAVEWETWLEMLD